MKVYVQDSLDGKEWRALWVMGQQVVLRSKAEARVWFQQFLEANDRPDWQVGYMVRFRDGKHYRLVTKKGEMKPG